MLILFLLLLASSIHAEEEPVPVAITQRLMSTLPELPQAIRGGLEGNADGLKSMISSVLGDGLISQLVVNPIGVAEEVFPDLGLNKTEVISNLDELSGGMASKMRSNVTGGSGSLLGKNSDLLKVFTTTQKTTTPEVMLVDGVPVKDFDDYVRKNGLEGVYRTKKPPPPTTPTPDAGAFADQVMIAIMQKSKGPAPPAPNHDDFASTLDMTNIDPKRRAEVNTLLRRAPQHFDTNDIFGGSPPGFVQATEPPSLDPEVNHVVQQIRTSNGQLNLDQISKLKGILNKYEEIQRTQEFIAKRSQLQVLRNELEAHRKKIDQQKRMEEELRKKEREIETMTLKMQEQLREQLSFWNLSLPAAGQEGFRPSPVDLPELNPQGFPTLAQAPTTTSLPTTEIEVNQAFDDALPTTTFSTLRYHPKNIRKSLPKRVPSRLSATVEPVPQPVVVPESTAIAKDIDDEFTSQCDCQEISLNKLQGHWIPALASQTMQGKIYEFMSNLLHQDASSELTCSRLQIWSPKVSESAQDARVSWEFRTRDSETTRRLTGNALSMDHKTVRMQMRDFEGDLFSAPMCVLKTNDNNDYVLVVKGNGPCNQAALLVRDPDDFFNNEDEELVQYLKDSIAQKKLEKLEMLNFANDCEQQ